MKKLLQKYIAIVTIAALLFVQTGNVVVRAEDAVTPTATPSTSSGPTATQVPTPSNEPASPTPTGSVSPSPTPSAGSGSSSGLSPTVTPTPTIPDPKVDKEAYKAYAKAQELAKYQVTPTPSTSSGPAVGSGSSTDSSASPTGENSGSSSNGNVGDTSLNSGNANNSATVATGANTNAAVTDSSPAQVISPATGATIVDNTGNGASSNNTAQVASASNSDTTQNNSAQVGNNLNQGATTGQSSTSFNVGNSDIKTGNANTSGTAITAVNTNLDGVMVSEFNIVDDQQGDLVLTPEAFQANCISGCGSGSANVNNTNNGANSTNNATANLSDTSNTFQNNDASVGNTMVLAANSGDNKSSFNTGGDSTITTGDANVSANSLTFANNNISGNVTYGVVNIYGNLEGDIILPEFGSASGDGVSNTNNGANSTNDASMSTDTNNNTFQNNDVNISNNLIFDANTGDNTSSNNTDGNTTVNTGQSNVDANVLNIANSNIDGGTWWLVLVNEAGNWIGHLVGSPDGSHMAGSEGTTFNIGSDGQVSASNNANGAGSNNTASTNTTSNNTTTQNNTANINNTLDLSANTGGNKTDFNTGGQNKINTGNANIIANLVNFVNNNIVGNGKLVVTVVNVFGSWLGDFVSPGQQKQAKQNQDSQIASANANPQGGTSDTAGGQQATTQQTNSGSQENVVPSPTAVPSTGFTVKTKKIFVNGRGRTVHVTAPTPEQKVAGASTDVPDHGNVLAFGGKKAININLAWFLLLLPVLVFGLIGKKFILAKVKKAKV